MKSVVFGDQTAESVKGALGKTRPWLKTQVYLSRNVSSSHIGFIQYSGIRAWCKLSRLILDFDKLAVRQLHVEPEGNRETKPVEKIAGERVETWWVYHVPQLFWGTIQNMPPSCKLHFVTSKMGPPPPTKSETMKRHRTLSRPLPGSSHRSASGTQPIYKLPLKYPWWSWWGKFLEKKRYPYKFNRKDIAHKPQTATNKISCFWTPKHMAQSWQNITRDAFDFSKIGVAKCQKIQVVMYDCCTVLSLYNIYMYIIHILHIIIYTIYIYILIVCIFKWHTFTQIIQQSQVVSAAPASKKHSVQWALT